MWRVVRILALVVVAVTIIVIGACSFRIRHYDAALAKVRVGDTEQEALVQLGTPTFRESKGVPYLRYTGKACVSPCAERLWWEWPIAPGIEAWSVEVDVNSKVLKTYHWVSP